MADQDDKVYYPEVIEENPFPGENQPPMESASASATVSTPKGGGESIAKGKPATKGKWPQSIIAHDTISRNLNTRSRKIMGEFELVDSGGLRVGKYANGVSGELILTPAGITARNMEGDTTFAIDGTTGNVVFAGEIQGGSININNRFSVDSEGNAIAKSLALVDSQFTQTYSPNQDIETTSYETVGDATEFIFDTPTILFYHADVQHIFNQTPSNPGDWVGRGIVRFRRTNQDTGEVTEVGTILMSGRYISGVLLGATGGGNQTFQSSGMHFEVLQPGTYTIQAVARMEHITNNAVLNIKNLILNVFTLGSFAS